MCIRFLFPALFCFLSIAPLSLAETSDSLTPRRNWRVIPEVFNASFNGEMLAPTSQGESAFWSVPERQGWIAFRLPAGTTETVMAMFRNRDRKAAPLLVKAEVSGNSTSGNDGTWKPLEELTLSRWPDKVEVPPAPENRWLRLNFAPDPSARQTTATAGAAGGSAKGIDLVDIGLYGLRPGDPQRHDYWLIVGASIQEQSIRNEVFNGMVRERHPGYDPVIFNLGVGGWRTGNLLKALPTFLERHPQAAYVGIHIGGNNVSGHRPWPGGAAQLEADLEKIIGMIQDAGKVPILSRLSYRAYKAKGDKGPVPPEENGSGPYVEKIYDPMIAKHCPAFFDKATQKGVVDAYSWFKEHPEELSPDGIHVNKTGEISWNRLWAEGAGDVVYGKAQGDAAKSE